MKGLGFGSIGGVLLWSRALGKVGAPGRNRTCDNQLRRLGLSPTELRARLIWSGREDLNLRRPAPKAGALPGCATPRHHPARIKALALTKARPRWLIRFFSSGVSSARVLPTSGT